ncbi:hypothetical protein [Spirosoma aerophilum]
MPKTTQELLPLLQLSQNVILVATDYSTGQLLEILQQMGHQTHITLKRASVKSTSELVRLAQNSPPGKITFDFS